MSRERRKAITKLTIAFTHGVKVLAGTTHSKTDLETTFKHAEENRIPALIETVSESGGDTDTLGIRMEHVLFFNIEEIDESHIVVVQPQLPRVVQ